MFYCEPCRESLNYPRSIGKSEGKCEECGKMAVCHEVKSSEIKKWQKENEPGYPGTSIVAESVGESDIPAAQAYVERQRRLNTAVSIKGEHITPLLFQRIGYRQRIAQEIMKGRRDPAEINELEDMFNRINDEIKSILGL